MTTPARHKPPAYGLTRFVADLPAGSRRMRTAPPSPSTIFLGATPADVCLDHNRLRVFQYATAAARLTDAATISSDGSRFSSGNRAMSVDWITTPHFYGRGRIIVLYLGSDPALTTQLHRLLGPALNPDAEDSAATTKDPC
jgi:hypothetical protein